ncbi:hypothetical protein RJ640_010456 [Escallonia rubra]|uniref:Uncharacterized protein n=1 Tax=Escallonia rubra TaxID=112253 RepID=A0AA88R8L3_9ASTE|nr:hypothetical protein RJ640_010456 [Escallonia rubra]
MVRAPSFDKNGLKKGAWSEEEDEKLRVYIQRYGHWNWRQLPKFAGLSRCGKSCRLRWKNYLQPNVKRGNYSKQEVELILKLHDRLGTKWSAMAEKLPGRTDNEIKNYWHTHLKKRAESNPKMNQATEKFPDTASENMVSDNHCQQSSVSHHLPAEASRESFSSSNDDCSLFHSSETFWEHIEDFWTKPFLADHTPCSQDDFLSALNDGEFSSSYYFCDGTEVFNQPMD